LKRRGLATHEFRVDQYGAPRYPELVLVVRHADLKADPELVRNTLAALEDGTRDAAADPAKALAPIQTASGASRAQVLAELTAIRPALSPPIRLRPASLAGWATFDSRFGILPHPPDVSRAFDTRVAP
ncbi:MAG: ABC transporter substrate-binding protein, partial [Gaiellaceae bacterium]